MDATEIAPGAARWSALFTVSGLVLVLSSIGYLGWHLMEANQELERLQQSVDHAEWSSEYLASIRLVEADSTIRQLRMMSVELRDSLFANSLRLDSMYAISARERGLQNRIQELSDSLYATENDIVSRWKQISRDAGLLEKSNASTLSLLKKRRPNLRKFDQQLKLNNKSSNEGQASDTGGRTGPKPRRGRPIADSSLVSSALKMAEIWSKYGLNYNETLLFRRRPIWQLPNWSKRKTTDTVFIRDTVYMPK